MDIFCKSRQEVGNIAIKEGNWSRLEGKLFTKCPLFWNYENWNVFLKKEVLTKHSPELFFLVTICFSYWKLMWISSLSTKCCFSMMVIKKSRNSWWDLFHISRVTCSGVLEDFQHHFSDSSHGSSLTGCGQLATFCGPLHIQESTIRQWIFLHVGIFVFENYQNWRHIRPLGT